MVNLTLGYIYTTEAEAMAASDLCDSYYGCPNKAAERWVAIRAWGSNWAIMYNDTLPIVLGQPIILPIVEEKTDDGAWLTEEEQTRVVNDIPIEDGLEP